MKMNGSKSHLLVLGNKRVEVTVNISGSLINESDEKLLGVSIDKKLNFKSHVNNLCKKASRKLHALPGISTYAEKPQLELTMTTFIMSCYKVEPSTSLFPLVHLKEKSLCSLNFYMQCSVSIFQLIQNHDICS